MSFDIQTPRFGPEIERQIFTQAAYASVYTASRLVLVADHVREWVEPILYRIVAIHEKFFWPPIESLDPSYPQALISTLRKHGRHVRHLLLNDTPTFPQEINSCLELCPDVVDLALLMDDTRISTIHLCARMKLKKLSIKLGNCLAEVDWESAAGIANHRSAVGRDFRGRMKMRTRLYSCLHFDRRVSKNTHSGV
ncbi:hypothetical protein BDN72DRAFT_907110 [Pluteus cervinus]|uniref:Uncharacterized protein n=1 Tax=Pluteus cervinus TaxID=181527 RepID=A0ACD2ZXU2_9AGAR|nr:hypothetical protein BDN72DRAFT_907110 [Pluteus cervinus]